MSKVGNYGLIIITKDKGKSIMETPMISHSSQLDEAQHKGE